MALLCVFTNENVANNIFGKVRETLPDKHLSVLKCCLTFTILQQICQYLRLSICEQNVSHCFTTSHFSSLTNCPSASMRTKQPLHGHDARRKKQHRTKTYSCLRVMHKRIEQGFNQPLGRTCLGFRYSLWGVKTSAKARGPTTVDRFAAAPAQQSPSRLHPVAPRVGSAKRTASLFTQLDTCSVGGTTRQTHLL